MPREWFYFGCHREAGHYLFLQGMRAIWRHGWPRELSRFDGMLPPQMDTAPYVATVSRLEGWGMTALAFWDYSVDKRGGCNSVVFAPSLTITPADLLAEAQVRFPEVFGRIPQPVRLLNTAAAPAAAAGLDATRSKFERWAAGEGFPLDLEKVGGPPIYRDAGTRGAWAAWWRLSNAGVRVEGGTSNG